MKLTKGKITKLYGKQKQSRKKNKKRKTSNKNRSFRRKRNLNLMRKSLKRYKGGVNDDVVEAPQVPPPLVESVAAEETPAESVVTEESVVAEESLVETPTESVVAEESLVETPTESVAGEESFVEPPTESVADADSVAPEESLVESPLDSLVTEESVAEPLVTEESVVEPLVTEESIAQTPMESAATEESAASEEIPATELTPVPLETLAMDDTLPPLVQDNIDSAQISQEQEIPVVTPVTDTTVATAQDPNIEQKIKIAEAATNLVKLINSNDIFVPQDAEVSVARAAEKVPTQVGGKNRKLKLTKKRRVK